ncbi:MAG: hypothetical protein WA208_06255 [Thermoanaerobaculia bacterium]
MSETAEVMQIVVNDDRGRALPERLRVRLERAALLRCADHGQPVVAITIHIRENGWFDTTWVTCCAELERQATAIVKNRC